ncbi:IS1634 family transposase [Collinsella tanakaei]|nr:IS1634 family transposase [Collinsella tanakaei]
MYLRKSRKKNGRVYLTIVEGYRDDRGKNMSRTVESLGYVDDLERSGIADPVAHFTEECARRNEAKRAQTEPVMVKIPPLQRVDKRDGEARVELGAAVVDAYLNRDLGLLSFFERRRTARKVGFDPYRVLELLAWDRIAHPSSKKGAWERRAAFPRKCPFSLDDVYRALTYLDERRGELVAHANASLEAARGPRDTRVLYYDVTNYYFEVEGEDGFRMRGVSKEHRPSPIVQMGLFLDADGIPLDYALFPGNVPDVSTLVPAMDRAGVRFGPDGPERVVVVADRGLNSSANIARCILDGNGYVFSQSVRGADRELKSWVLSEEGYAANAAGTWKVKSRIGEKAVYVAGEDGRRRRVMVPVKQVAFWSRDFAERSRAERAKVVEKSLRAIERGDAARAYERSSSRYARPVPVDPGTGEVGATAWVLDEARIAEDARCDGYYCIVTSEQDMADGEVIDCYRGLWRIEESFRVVKGEMDARPVYLSTEAHIRAHFLVCFVALLVMRLMQADVERLTGSRPSARAVQEALAGVVGHRLDGNHWIFDYRTDLTDALGDAVGVDLSRRVASKGRVRDIMASVRKPRS